jgi:ABC-type maltose transport system permease subunit
MAAIESTRQAARPVIPVIALFMALQRQLIGGFTLGGVKG